MARLVLLGAGQIGEALLAGLLDGTMDADAIVVVEARPGRAEEVAARHGVAVVAPDEVEAVVDGLETLVVAVKPQDVLPVLDRVGPALPPGAVVVSVAAGVGLRAMEARLPSGTPVVRVMPNTPVLVRRGVCAVAGGSHADVSAVDRVADLLAPLGAVVRVAEAQMDAVTAVSGSGPAYVYLFAEAFLDAAVAVGLGRDVARSLVLETIAGAAEMLVRTGTHPVLLREQVSSPAGTTVAAVGALEEHAVRAAVAAAVRAAAARSAELSREQAAP